MWVCGNCGEEVDDNFGVCWNCGTAQDGLPGEYVQPQCPRCQGEDFVEDRITELDLPVGYCPNCEGVWFDRRELQVDYQKIVPLSGDPGRVLAATQSLFVPLDFEIVLQTDSTLVLRGPGHPARESGGRPFGQISKLCVHVGKGDLSLKAEFGAVAWGDLLFRVFGTGLILAALSFAVFGSMSNDASIKGLIGAAIILTVLG
ncbi:MAG: zf-TFIIB domain-containing protein, partial [Phycisphaerales bacterium]